MNFKYVGLATLVILLSCCVNRNNPNYYRIIKNWEKVKSTKEEIIEIHETTDVIIKNINQFIKDTKDLSDEKILYYGIPLREIISVEKGDLHIYTVRDPISKERHSTFDGDMIIFRVQIYGDCMIFSHEKRPMEQYLTLDVSM